MILYFFYLIPIYCLRFAKRVKKEGIPALLEKFSGVLATLEPFNVERIEAAPGKFSQEENVPPGDLIHALRLSTTGSPIGPGVYDCLVLLGKEKSLARIAGSLKRV